MTDPIAATPGWVDARLDTLFTTLPEAAKPAGDAFAECLARSKAPAAPSDLLGTEFAACHTAFRQALRHAGIPQAKVHHVLAQLEALEAEIAADS